MRITVHFERDGEGRPRGAVAPAGGGQLEQFHGWLELLRALEQVVTASGAPIGQGAAAD